MIITNSNSDYSALGLGNADWRVQFCANAGITDPAKIAAVKKLHDDAVAAGIWSKIYAVCFWPGATAATQKFIFREALDAVTFVGAAGNSADGFTPNTGVYAEAPIGLPVGVNPIFSIGVWNGTAETFTGSSVNDLAGVYGENILNGDATRTADYRIELSRHYGAATTAATASQLSGTARFVLTTAGAYPSTNIGFLQFIKNGSSFKILDEGVEIATSTAADSFNITGGGARKLMIGGLRAADGSAQAFSKALNKFTYWGALTLAEAQSWNTIVHTFMIGFGR